MPSLGATYFDGIFAKDDDPWSLASSDYERAKFDATCQSMAGIRYERALEIGCAHGVLTERLADLCESLLAIDISARALELARRRIGERPGVEFARMTFPREQPHAMRFDLVVLSEVAYYWDDNDLGRAARWLSKAVVPGGGRIILVHYIGETDYPHSGDAAVEALWRSLEARFAVELSQRHAQYRLDLWCRR